MRDDLAPPLPVTDEVTSVSEAGWWLLWQVFFTDSRVETEAAFVSESWFCVPAATWLTPGYILNMTVSFP